MLTQCWMAILIRDERLIVLLQKFFIWVVENAAGYYVGPVSPSAANRVLLQAFQVEKNVFILDDIFVNLPQSADQTDWKRFLEKHQLRFWVRDIAHQTWSMSLANNAKHSTGIFLNNAFWGIIISDEHVLLAFNLYII